MFIIPKHPNGRTLADDPDLLRLVEQARGKGHEFYQHGHVHTPFESGVPALWMLDFNQQVKREYDQRRLEIEQGHTFEALTAMIESGHRIWRRAFHEESPGYRPGWGAFCANLYGALDALGYAWVSSRIPLPTSWLWNQGRWDAPVEMDGWGGLAPYRIGRLWEFPLGGDYGFQVPSEEARIQAMVDLAWREFLHCHEKGFPFIMVSHWHGLERNGGTGYAVHERLVPRILQSGKAEPMGFARLASRHAAA
jgi:hypothetical protein